MENCFRKVLFCDTDPVWRTVVESYCFVMRSQCGEQLQECIVLLYGASVDKIFRKVLFCDMGQCGEL